MVRAGRVPVATRPRSTVAGTAETGLRASPSIARLNSGASRSVNSTMKAWWTAPSRAGTLSTTSSDVDAPGFTSRAVNSPTVQAQVFVTSFTVQVIVDVLVMV